MFETALSGERDVAPSLPTIVFVNCPEVSFQEHLHQSKFLITILKIAAFIDMNQASITVALPGTSKASATFLEAPAKPEEPFQTLVAAVAWLIVVLSNTAKGLSMTNSYSTTRPYGSVATYQLCV